MSSKNTRTGKGGPLILPEGTQKDASKLRARDVRFELQGCGLNPKLVSILERLAERGHYLQSQMVEMATLQNQMIDLLQQFSDVAGNMKEAQQRIDKALGDGGVGDDVHTAEN